MGIWGFALLNGLSVGAATFLVAAGLTLIFGILKILNFAHGVFFTVGAYITFSLIGAAPESTWAYIGASLLAGLVVGVIGWGTDLVVLRRLRSVDHSYTLIATFALLLLGTGLVKLTWGLSPQSVSPPPLLQDAWTIGTLVLPVYSLFLMAAAVVVYLALEALFTWSRIGKIINAVARDPWMAGLLGINVPAVMTGAVVVSFMLVGLAGGLMLANQSLTPELGNVYLLLAFNAVIVGGLGSVRGAFIASFLLGMAESVVSVLLPGMPGIAIYLILIAFLLIRPQGLVRVEPA